MSTPLIANVLGRRPSAASPDAVIEALREQFGGINVDLLLPSVEGKRGYGLMVDGIPVILIFEDFSLNLAELKPWHGRLRDSDGPLLENAGHVMIGTPPGIEGHSATLRASLAVLRVASVLSEQPGAHAVLWSPADSLMPAHAFRAEIAEASAQHAPIGILTRVGQFQTGMEGNKPLLGAWAMAPAASSDAMSSSPPSHFRPTSWSTVSPRSQTGCC